MTKTRPDPKTSLLNLHTELIRALEHLKKEFPEW